MANPKTPPVASAHARPVEVGKFVLYLLEFIEHCPVPVQVQLNRTPAGFKFSLHTAYGFRSEQYYPIAELATAHGLQMVTQFADLDRNIVIQEARVRT